MLEIYKDQLIWPVLIVNLQIAFRLRKKRAPDNGSARAQDGRKRGRPRGTQRTPSQA